MLKRFKIKKLENTLAEADTYGQWLEIARELDRLEGMDAWRQKDESSHYNYKMVRLHLEQMQAFRETANVYRLVDTLHDSLRRNMGDLTTPALYAKARAGTKVLIGQYLDEAEKGLNFLCDNDFVQLPKDKKIRLFRQAGHNFGRTALMLSGGATMGLFHLGVVKVLWEQGLLPRVISGSSMGSLVASGACTKTDEELDRLIVDQDDLDLRALKRLSMAEMWREKAVMSQGKLMRNIRKNIGDYTFAEAYERTGRVLNITVSPTRAGLKARVLNYATAPNVLIASAALASCSVPLLWPPTRLIAKDRAGGEKPYMQNELWVDGSIADDLPTARLARLHNVNHSIVSQTNPHVLPFISSMRRPGMLPFFISLAGSMAQAQILEVVGAVRQHVHQPPWRTVLDHVFGVISQSYGGDINIQPRFQLWYYPRLLTNPSKADVDRFTLEGERATWPMVETIRNQTRISRTFEDCLRRLDPDREPLEWRPL